MALKRQHNTLSMFSMASMTDVIFLLLIFFMDNITWCSCRMGIRPWYVSWRFLRLELFMNLRYLLPKEYTDSSAMRDCLREGHCWYAI